MDLKQVAILICVVAVAFYGGYLIYSCKYDSVNKHHKQKFVGVMGRAPGMEHCNVWDGDQTRWSTFNRCTWI
jgi:hypothetical protein